VREPLLRGLSCLDRLSTGFKDEEGYDIDLHQEIVHRQSGVALCILPISSQHRGRLFLPFVDDNPKTAEIMSKVLLLAKDKEIQDPTILEQILLK
jgi:hypothetical protein